MEIASHGHAFRNNVWTPLLRRTGSATGSRTRCATPSPAC
jgi:hypothetical protein